MNKDFLKAVLSGEKQLLKKIAVNQITVPHYDELSVRKLYPQFKSDKQFTSYFPDTYPKDKGPPRQYFFDVLNTVYPDYLRQIMTHANNERMAADTDQNRTSSIAISQFWEEELKSMPYLSSKCSMRYIVVIKF